MDMATGKRSELSDYESGMRTRPTAGFTASASTVTLRACPASMYAVATGRITRDFDFDIESWSIAIGKRIAVLANVAGTTKLKLYDGDPSR